MKRRAFTLIELLVVVAIIALLIAILLPSLGKARELSNRSVCMANCRGMSQALNVYSSDQADAYPVCTSLVAKDVKTTGLTGLTGTKTGDPATTIKSMFAAAQTNGGGSVLQNMWILVVQGSLTPKQFLCKSDPGTPSPATVQSSNSYNTNFDNANSYSYGFAWTWTQAAGTSPTSVGSWWKNQTDATLPLLGDIGPKDLSGAGTDKTSYTQQDTNLPLKPTKQANSFNHQRDGQNIGYGDGHATFEKLANCGQSADNVFTTGSQIGSPDPVGSARTWQTVPNNGTGGSPSNYDIILVPYSDGASGRG